MCPYKPYKPLYHRNSECAPINPISLYCNTLPSCCTVHCPTVWPLTVHLLATLCPLQLWWLGAATAAPGGTEQHRRAARPAAGSSRTALDAGPRCNARASTTLGTAMGMWRHIWRVGCCQPGASDGCPPLTCSLFECSGCFNARGTDWYPPMKLFPASGRFADVSVD
jgi:hypothetical protein